jgi:hypothetical protein
MIRPEKNLSVYYLGLTVVHTAVLKRVQQYRDKLMPNLPKIKEVHITLVPPFFTDFETASAINWGCMTSTLSSKSIVNSIQFSIQNLAIMEFEGEKIIHFPVKTYEKGKEVRDENFAKRVQTLRKQLEDLGVKINLPIPDGYTPHISVSVESSKKGISKKIGRVLEKSSRETVLCFRATYPTLYAKYRGIGYRTLSSDPSIE